MLSTTKETDLFCAYYAQWIKVYKEGAVRKVTLGKYSMALTWLQRLVPNLRLQDVNRATYQQLLNEYAATHEKQTTQSGSTASLEQNSGGCGSAVNGCGLVIAAVCGVWMLCGTKHAKEKEVNG